MKYYVYELIDPRSNKPFYVGKGKNKRLYFHVDAVKNNKILKNKMLFNKIKKLLQYGLKVKYKKIFLTDIENDAYKKEMERISELGIENLCNLTYGGDGMRPTKEIRKKISENNGSRRPEVRKKMSDAHKGKHPWNFGKVGVQVSWNKGLTKDTDERVKKYSNTKMGHIVTDETKTKIRETKKRKYKEGVYTTWNKGKKGLQVAWNKGLTKETDERLKKCGETNRRNGKKRGKPAWNKGLTKETDGRVKKYSHPHIMKFGINKK